MIHEFIRLTAVSFSSNNCQTKVQQLSDEYFYVISILEFSKVVHKFP